MLDAILEVRADDAVVDAPALIAGEWITKGTWDERSGPYVRRVVSRAPAASHCSTNRTGFPASRRSSGTNANTRAGCAT